MQLNKVIQILLMTISAMALVNCGSGGSSVGSPAAATPSNSFAPVVVPQDYPGATLNPNTALNQMGNWVPINGEQYFQPTSYTSPGEEEWAPYRHGYWAWSAPGAAPAVEPLPAGTETEGWTWISYDPWGWMTDHYGVWRHHETYGWIWLPFTDMHYQPHAVTWMDSGDYIGWYPYSNDERCRPFYEAGVSLGFDDGFWLGFGVTENFGGPEFRFQLGLAIVSRRDVTAPNIINVMINKSRELDHTSIEVVRSASAQNHLYSQPGGELKGSKEFINSAASKPGAVTQVTSVRSKGGAQIIIPKPVNSVPAESQNAGKKNPKGGAVHSAPAPKSPEVSTPSVPAQGGDKAHAPHLPNIPGVGNNKPAAPVTPEKPKGSADQGQKQTGMTPAPAPAKTAGSTPAQGAKPNGNSPAPSTVKPAVTSPPSAGAGQKNPPVANGAPAPKPTVPAVTAQPPAPVAQAPAQRPGQSAGNSVTFRPTPQAPAANQVSLAPAPANPAAKSITNAPAPAAAAPAAHQVTNAPAPAAAAPSAKSVTNSPAPLTPAAKSSGEQPAPITQPAKPVAAPAQSASAAAAPQAQPAPAKSNSIECTPAKMGTPGCGRSGDNSSANTGSSHDDKSKKN